MKSIIGSILSQALYIVSVTYQFKYPKLSAKSGAASRYFTDNWVRPNWIKQLEQMNRIKFMSVVMNNRRPNSDQ